MITVNHLWKPERPIEIVAGTPPGGGLDRVARALARTLTEAKLLDVPVEVVNVPGDGARKAWTYLDKYPGDAHVVSISSPNLTSDHLVGIASFDHSRYTPISTLLTEYIAFAVRTDSPLRNGADLMRRLGTDASNVSVALSTALGNPNHVAFAMLTQQAGGDIRAPNIRVFDTALDAVADVVAGNADVSVVTAASVLAELTGGRVRVIALSAPARLSGPFADAPVWKEQGADCVIGAWRGVTGPAGITAPQVTFWQNVLRTATAHPSWHDELSRLSWSPMYLDGDALRAYFTKEHGDFVTVLGGLGLLKSPRA
jgi:putative tricarboxylic transport membrane protein